MSARLLAASLAALTLAACDLPAAKERPRLLTLADLEAVADDPAQPALLPDHGVPGGLPIADYVTKVGSSYELTLRDTWTEGYRSAYVTTELWSGFDEVWVQPMYLPIRGIVNGEPDKVLDDDSKWRPVFSVGPKSAFYSPFWQLFYVVVPDGTAFDKYTSARDVVNAGLPLISAGGRAVALVPGPVGLPKTPAPANPMDLPARFVGGPKPGDGFLDGQPVSFLDFGAETFRFNQHLVVEEIPLFVLVYRRPDGTLARLDVPTVAGTGPLYANRPVDAPNDHPRYGAFWRLYTVEVPPTARVFAPPLFADLRAKLPDAFIAGAPYGAKVAAVNDPTALDEFAGRVALNAVPVMPATTACFETYELLSGDDTTAPCQWLDSQPAIERALVPEAIKKTDLVVTCPFVSYHDKAVTP